MKAGHNSKLTEDEQRALYMHHLRRCYTAKQAADKAKAELSQLKKQAKAEGIMSKDIDFGFRVYEIDDQEIIPEEMRRTAEIAKWLGLPIAYQADMFDDVANQDERIRSAGYSAGQLNKDRLSGYAGGSNEDKIWLKAYDQGRTKQQKDLDSALEKMSDEEEPDAPDEEGETEEDPDEPPTAA